MAAHEPEPGSIAMPEIMITAAQQSHEQADCQQPAEPTPSTETEHQATAGESHIHAWSQTLCSITLHLGALFLALLTCLALTTFWDLSQAGTSQ